MDHLLPAAIKMFVAATFLTFTTSLVSAQAPLPLRDCFDHNEHATTDIQFARCVVCATPRLEAMGSQWAPHGIILDCASNTPLSPASTAIAKTLVEYGNRMGVFWENASLATVCLDHLVAHMPRRDAMKLSSDTFIDFLFEHVRYAIASRIHGHAWATDIPLPIFLDYVLPYAFLDEKRDIEFKWRPRFNRLLMPLVVGTANVTAAMHIVAKAVPSAQLTGGDSVMCSSATTPGAPPPAQCTPIHWRSETSPMNMSPEQVAAFGGSCTGTAITMAAAARSVGIPIRIAGCSQSVKGDDHHWTEFYDPSSGLGPFGDGWHTREGTSAGNKGGPWDAPSGPMSHCLSALLPKNRLNTMWASVWSSSTELPLLWDDSVWAAQWSHVGGVNRCGAYCTAWGCGVNQTSKWTQPQCAP